MFMTFLGLPRYGRPQRSSLLSHAVEILSASLQTYRILMKEIPRPGGQGARDPPRPHGKDALGAERSDPPLLVGNPLDPFERFQASVNCSTDDSVSRVKTSPVLGARTKSTMLVLL